MEEFAVARIRLGTVVNIEVVTDEWLKWAKDNEPDHEFVRVDYDSFKPPIIGLAYSPIDGFEQVTANGPEDEDS